MREIMPMIDKHHTAVQYARRQVKGIELRELQALEDAALQPTKVHGFRYNERKQVTANELEDKQAQEKKMERKRRDQAMKKLKQSKKKGKR